MSATFAIRNDHLIVIHSRIKAAISNGPRAKGKVFRVLPQPFDIFKMAKESGLAPGNICPGLSGDSG